MYILAFDLGNSGLRSLGFECFPNQELVSMQDFENCLDITPQQLVVNVIQRISKTPYLKGQPYLIGLSIAGIINYQLGTWVRWKNEELNIHIWPEIMNCAQKSCHPNIQGVHLLNDGEAHLFFSKDQLRPPILSVALGSSPAVAFSDLDGKLFRPRGTNLEVGGFLLRTSAHDPNTWWALGKQGLQSLLEEEPTQKSALERYGYRVGAFLCQLSGLFQPRSIVLSGGLTSGYGEGFMPTLLSEFNTYLPAWLAEPPEETQVSLAKDLQYTALWGIAKAVTTEFA